MKRLPRTLVATAALAAVATASAPGWGSYVVRSGDTLWGLARQHHTTVHALQAANHISGSLIYAGQKIDVPGVGAPATAQRGASTASTYTVHTGDTLTAVARAHHTTISVLARANHLSGRLTIYVGQHLQIPAAGVVFAATPKSPSYAPLIAASAAHLASEPAPSSAHVQAMVAAEAKRQGVDPTLALAIADQESGFSQQMVSATDAVGVMQLMASTATWLTDYSHRPLNRYNAADNIRGGVELLAILRAQANVPDTIAGYYQGIASVRATGMLPQTKTYVANVEALMRRMG